MKNNGKCVERPQYMWLRVAIGIHENNLDLVKETYDLLSQKYFIHATPTLFNSEPKTTVKFMFLLAMEDDSIEGIFNTLKNVPKFLNGQEELDYMFIIFVQTEVKSKGQMEQVMDLVPMLRVFNNAARYVDQGGGKRPGSFSIYLEPWHLDLEAFLEMKKITVMKSIKGEICFMHYGYQICL